MANKLRITTEFLEDLLELSRFDIKITGATSNTNIITLDLEGPGVDNLDGEFVALEYRRADEANPGNNNYLYSVKKV